jgi:hypothetical protein
MTKAVRADLRVELTKTTATTPSDKVPDLEPSPPLVGGEGGPEPDAKDRRHVDIAVRVHGVEIRVDGVGFTPGWLNSLARVVKAIPDDLRKEMESIWCWRVGEEDWPPSCPDGSWHPGYWISANPAVIQHETVRDKLNDVFLRVDGGHPGIGWRQLEVPWEDGKPSKELYERLLPDEPHPGRLLLTDEEEHEMRIEPVGWGAAGTRRN